MKHFLLLGMSALIRRPGASALALNASSLFRHNSHISIHTFAATQYRSHRCLPKQVVSLQLPRRNYLSTKSSGRYASTKTKLRSSKDCIDGQLLQPDFKKGDLVMAEVIFFGPLGASVDIIAHNSHNPSDCISQDEPALGRGMILQNEINYFRRGRGGVDVVKYEVLPAYVENTGEKVINDDGDVELRLDISLRPPGGKAKAEELGEKILRKLKESDGILDVGDKSSPEEIDEAFPGSSKSAFKKAVAGLYRRGLVTPGPNSISLT